MRGTPEQFARLPKWARLEIETLNMRLAEQEARAERAEAAAGVVQDQYGCVRPISPRDDVVYGDLNDIRRQIFVSEKASGVLRVDTGGQALIVRPCASNDIEIRMEPF